MIISWTPRRLWVVLLIVQLTPGTLPRAAAAPPEPVVNDPCSELIRQAEQRLAIPPRLLLAIALVESGRATGGPRQVAPWPWALNLEGVSLYPPTREEAARRVTDAQATGMTSIDVGCMQVNLQQHSHAFSSVNDALDPAKNVAYAAGFLVRLHQSTGDWSVAVGFYHSHTPTLADTYRTRVAERFASDMFTAAVMDKRSSLLRQLGITWATTLRSAPIEPAGPGSWAIPWPSPIVPTAKAGVDAGLPH